MEQRFVVNGINNDKIELVSNYDVRKLNRLLDAKDRMWISKIKQVREEIEDRETYDGIYIDRADVLEILDKLIKESEK